MRLNLRLLGILALFGVGILSAVFLADERNLQAVFQPRGEVTSGIKFGASIGTPREATRRALEEKGFEFVLTEGDGMCGQTNSSSGEYLDLFRDYSWRRGGVCVLVSNGVDTKVIAWAYQPFAW
jgi:hypothetical protein